MKIITYHYVKKEKKEYPNLKPLSFKKFKNQINFFIKNGGISDDICKNNYNKNSYLLTFDDGLKDHLMVAEYLKKEKVKGTFFISCNPLINKKILPVHQMHIILAKRKINEVYKFFFNECAKLNDENIDLFLKKNDSNQYYKPLNDSKKNKDIKKVFNYCLSKNNRLKILKKLNNYFDINIKAEDYYLNKKEIKYMKNIGMEIGSHGINHEPLLNLNFDKQKNEILNSKLYLEKFLKKEIRYFCFPYGWKYSYNANTLKILKKSKYDLSFAVEKRPVNKKDILNKYELPRYDTNDMPS